MGPRRAAATHRAALRGAVPATRPGRTGHSQPRLLADDPGGQLVGGQHGDVIAATQPVVVEPAQPAPGDVLATAAGDPAIPAAGQRESPGQVDLDRFAGVPPEPFVAETQPPAVHVALAAGHRTAPRLQWPSRAPVRRRVELLPGDPDRHPGPPAAVATAMVTARRGRAARGSATPCRGPVTVQIAGEQRTDVVPLTRPPGRVEMTQQPVQPASLAR